MISASSGVLANFLPNEYYSTAEAHLYALTEVLRDEYRAIVDMGLPLQDDCPGLAMTRVSRFSPLAEEGSKEDSSHAR